MNIAIFSHSLYMQVLLVLKKGLESILQVNVSTLL